MVNIALNKFISFPLIMNTIQFWIIDTIVKHKLNADEEYAQVLLRLHEESEDEYQPIITQSQDLMPKHSTNNSSSSLISVHTEFQPVLSSSMHINEYELESKIR